MSGARRTTTAPSRHSRIKPKNADREKRSDCGQPPKCANAIRQTPTTRSTCSPFAGSVSQAVQTPYSTGIELHCRTGCTLLLPAVAPASFVALWRSHCYPSVILCKAITVCTDIYSTPAAATTTTIAKPGQTGHLHCICSLSLSLSRHHGHSYSCRLPEGWWCVSGSRKILQLFVVAWGAELCEPCKVCINKLGGFSYLVVLREFKKCSKWSEFVGLFGLESLRGFKVPFLSSLPPKF